MAGRRTNLALLALVAAALATGVLAFAVGTSTVRLVTLAHGVVGLAIVLLAPWKSAIAKRGMARPRADRILSILLSIAVVATISSGVLFSTGLVLSYGSLTAMQIHVGAGVVTALLGAAHVWRRPVRPRRRDLDTRNLGRAAVLSGVAGVLWLGIEGTARALDWPGGRRRFTGSHETGSFNPGRMPVTQWLNDRVQRIEPDTWHLQLFDRSGGVRSLSYRELLRATDSVTATLDCTGGWYATQRWVGMRLDRLIELSGESIAIKSATGYERRFPMSDAAHLLLAHSVGGNVLSPGHGAPARLVAPGRRGGGRDPLRVARGGRARARRRT